MKKLMIALAAVATAFGLRAADTGFVSGAGFDTTDTANPEGGFYTWLNNTSGIEGTGFVDGYWSDGVSNATVKAETYTYDGDHPAQYAGDKDRNYDQYVSIQTTFGNPVSMSVKQSDAGQRIGDGFYYDSLVNMTACDEAPDFTKAAYSDAKIYVYAKQNDPEDDTAGANYYVAAADAEGAVTEYKTATAFAEGWHRLTVKMIKSVLKGEDTDVGFVVYVDGQALAGENLSANEAFTAAEAANLTPAAYKWYENGRLFRSLAKTTDEVKGVAFDGKGDIDEVAFTTTAPDFAVDAKFFSVGWNDETIDSVSVNGTALTSNPQDIEFQPGSTYTYEAKDNYVSVTDPTEFDDLEVGGEYTLNADPAAACYTIGGVTKYVADLGSAVDAVNLATENVTLKLCADADAIVIDNAEPGVEITLDLAGKKIEAEDDDVIFVTAGNLTIIDSVGDGQVNALGDESSGYALSVAEGAFATVNAGQFNGGVSVECYEPAGALINGGEFLAEANTKADLDPFAKDGYEFTQAEGSDYLELTEVQDEPFSGGTGTELDPYLISNVDDLIELKTEVAAGNYLTAFFVQTADINFADVEVEGGWDGIGTTDNKFAGTFDGGEYKFTGALALVRKSYGGLFGECNGATIKNVTFDSTVVLAPPAGSGSAGYAVIGRAGDNTKMINITMSGKIGTEANPCNHNVAGIAVSSGKNVLFENCVMDGQLYTKGPDGDHVKAGGMVSICSTGDNATYTTFKGCTVSGKISNKTVFTAAKPDDLATAGALCGYSNSGIKVIDNCDVSGVTFDVTAAGEWASVDCGMFFGYCSDVFEVTNTTAAAGIVAVGSHANANNAKQLWLATIDSNGKAVYDASTLSPDLTGAITYKVMLPCATFTLENEGDKLALDETLCEATVAAADAEKYEIKKTGNVYECVEKPTFPLDPDAELTDAGEANMAAVIEAFGDGLTTWVTDVYGKDGKVPASKLNATTDELIAAAKEFNLPIMTAGVEVEVEAAAEGFTFKIVDDGTPINVQAAYLQKLIKYAAALETGFGDSTGKVGLTNNNTSFDAKFTTPDAAAGFMKADMTVEK